MRKEAKEKLVEKNIKWHEEYTDKTQFLKDQFESVVGPGSYFRFEGLAPNGDGYYCIIGPAKVHAPKAKFFAGVRKLPATYSAGGKYFDSLDTAAKYAKETWGVPTPQNLTPYTSRQLVGISGRVSEWKDKRDKEDDKDKKKDKKDIESFNIDVLLKEAMGGVNKNLQEDYIFQTYETIIANGCEDFKVLADNNPAFYGALNEITLEKRKRYAIYRQKYGFSEEKLREIFRVYVGYSGEHGLYAFYVGPYQMSSLEQELFYQTLGKLGLFNGDAGTDIPNETIRDIMNSPDRVVPYSDHGESYEVGEKKQRGFRATTLKGLAKRHLTDRSGWFDVFQQKYPVTNELRAEDELAKLTKSDRLDQFKEYGIVKREDQIENIGTTGSPLVQGFGLDDYSYVYNYNLDYKPFKQKNNDTRKNRDWFGIHYQGPHGRAFGTHLPANDLSDPMCQIYSLSNYDQAKENNMILSSKGTRIILNQDGILKVMINVIGLCPEYNQEFLSYLSTHGMLIKNMKPQAVQVITRNMNNFLHFLSGTGEMSDADIEVVSRRGPMTSNGVLDPNDVRTKTNTKGKTVTVEECGRNIYRTFMKWMKSFYVNRIAQDIFDAEAMNEVGSEEIVQKLKSKKDNISRLLGLSKGYTAPSVSKATQAQVISSSTKNELLLLAEIAEFMSNNDIQTAQFEEAKKVADFLNGGGSDSVDEYGILKWTRSPTGRMKRTKDKNFNAGNVTPLMQKVINQSLADGQNLSIAETALNIADKAEQAKMFASDEHGNESKKKKKAKAALAAENGGMEEGGDERKVNLVWDEEKQKFIVIDVHKSFYDVFEFVQRETETMTYSKTDRHLREKDEGTGVILLPTDEMGNTKFMGLSPTFRNPPKKNIESVSLEEAFRGRTPDQQAKARLSWGNAEMYQAFSETFGPELMKAIDLADYEYQRIEGEVTDEALAQEGDNDLPDVNIPPENENIGPEEVVVAPAVDEDVEVDYQAQFGGDADPFADMDEEGLDFGENNENNEDELRQDASTDTINNLLKLSQELDNEGKVAESIELLRLAKKFSGRTRRG